MFYDIEKVLEAADVETVASHIGMELLHKGKYTMIRCPGHFKNLGKEDRHITNAHLVSGRFKKGYHCYACHGASGVTGLIDMVMEFLNCDFITAVEHVIDSTGQRRESFSRDSASRSYKAEIVNNKYRLLREESSVIGLVSGTTYTKNPYKMVVERDDRLPMDKSDDGYVVYSSSPFSLESLMIENMDAYKLLVKNKAYEAYFKYIEFAKETKDCLPAVSEIYLEYARMAKKIYKKFGGKERLNVTQFLVQPKKMVV